MAMNHGAAMAMKTSVPGSDTSRAASARAPHQQQPRDNDRDRQHDADQALGEHAERRRGIRGEQRPARPRLAVSRRSAACGQQHDRRGDAAGDQHVEVGELRAAEEQRLRREHHERPARGPRVAPAPQQHVQRQRRQQRAEQRCDARRPRRRRTATATPPVIQ